jgi:hypothetical protein
MPKFVKGQSGNPKGRAPLSVEQKRVRALTARLKSRDFLDIIDKVIALAKRGEKWAVELLFKYQIGLPKQPVALEQDGEIKINVSYVEDPEFAPANFDPEAKGD